MTKPENLPFPLYPWDKAVAAKKRRSKTDKAAFFFAMKDLCHYFNTHKPEKKPLPPFGERGF
jgi:hypothetical protein